MRATPFRPGHQALRRGRVSIPQQLYLISCTTQNRSRIFNQYVLAHAAAKSFEDPTILRDTRMLCWVLMPDHAHWLIQLGQRDELEALMLRLKSASARRVNQLRDHASTVWARAYHDHALRREEDVHAVAQYVINNPLRAGLVSHIGDYPYWNAYWL